MLLQKNGPDSEDLQDKANIPIYPETWSNIPDDKIQYNMLNGDTLGDLWQKLKTASNVIQGGSEDLNGELGAAVKEDDYLDENGE